MSKTIQAHTGDRTMRFRYMSFNMRELDPTMHHSDAVIPAIRRMIRSLGGETETPVRYRVSIIGGRGIITDLFVSAASARTLLCAVISDKEPTTLAIDLTSDIGAIVTIIPGSTPINGGASYRLTV